MALTELITARQQINTATRITVVRRWKVPTSQIALGAGGWVGSGVTLPAKGDALGLTGDDWTNKVEPRCYDVQVNPRYRRKTAMVTARYGAPQCQGTATGTRVELANSQSHSVDYQGKWNGIRRWSTPDADLVTNRDALRSASWTVNSIAMIPHEVYSEIDAQCPGTSIITCRFAFPEDPNRFEVGKGYLSVLVDTVAMRAKTIAGAASPPGAAEYIEGDTDPNLLLGLHWKPVQGSNIVRVRRVIVRVTTAFSRTAFDWDTHISNYYDTNGRAKKNSDACANILKAKAGELLMLGAEIPRAFVLDSNNTKIPVIYTMLFAPGGVEKDMAGQALMVAQFHKALAMKYVLHPTDTAGTRLWMATDGSAIAGTDSGPNLPPLGGKTAKYRIAAVDKMLSAAAASRTLYAEVAYASINSLIWWGA